MRSLKRFRNFALSDLGDHGFPGCDREKLALQIIGWLPLPDIEDHVDAFEEHGIPVLVEIAIGFSIGHQSAGGNAEIQPAF